MTLIDRSRPLVAVVFRIPLFVEAIVAAFDGLAEIQGVRAADERLNGLLEALRPQAVVVESARVPEFRTEAVVFQVDLESAAVRQLVEGRWRELDVELSGEDIRNAVLNAVVSQAVA
jgi:hypothetical protein